MLSKNSHKNSISLTWIFDLPVSELTPTLKVKVSSNDFLIFIAVNRYFKWPDNKSTWLNVDPCRNLASVDRDITSCLELESNKTPCFGGVMIWYTRIKMKQFNIWNIWLNSNNFLIPSETTLLFRIHREGQKFSMKNFWLE